MRNHIYTSYNCRNKKCWSKLRPSNAATNFTNPSLAVQIAVEKEILSPGCKVLEVGSGNLRNALFIVKHVPGVFVTAYDLKPTMERFASCYEKFRNIGGCVVGTDYWKRKYDFVVSSFVLETICPKRNRVLTLKSIRLALKKGGVFLGSFRGYPGVRGSRYRKCPLDEGLLTSLNTFVRPYSIPEIRQLLLSCGFKGVSMLQKYRVENPENIHLIATLEVRDGKKMA